MEDVVRKDMSIIIVMILGSGNVNVVLSFTVWMRITPTVRPSR